VVEIEERLAERFATALLVFCVDSLSLLPMVTQINFSCLIFSASLCTFKLT